MADFTDEEAELDRRYPDRRKMRPADADGFREAWGATGLTPSRNVGPLLFPARQ